MWVLSFCHSLNHDRDWRNLNDRVRHLNTMSTFLLPVNCDYLTTAQFVICQTSFLVNTQKYSRISLFFTWTCIHPISPRRALVVETGTSILLLSMVSWPFISHLRIKWDDSCDRSSLHSLSLPLPTFATLRLQSSRRSFYRPSIDVLLSARFLKPLFQSLSHDPSQSHHLSARSLVKRNLYMGWVN